MHYWLGDWYRKTVPFLAKWRQSTQTREELHTFSGQKQESNNASFHWCWSMTQVRHWTKKIHLTQKND
jgi:hypothetical protein